MFENIKTNIVEEDIKEYPSEVILSVNEINNLTIDQLLTYRYQGTKIIVSHSESSFNIRWNKDDLDIPKDREDLIINAIKALVLKMEMEKRGDKYYNDCIKEILDLGKELPENNRKLLGSILNIDLTGRNKDISDNKSEIGFKDMMNLVSRIKKSNDALSTMGGKVDYIINKLQLVDPTEIVFTILALTTLGEEED